MEIRLTLSCVREETFLLVLYTTLPTFLCCKPSSLYAITSCKPWPATWLIPAPAPSLQATGGMPLWSNSSKMDFQGFEKINTTFITPDGWSWENCTLAAERKGRDRPRQAGDCKSLKSLASHPGCWKVSQYPRGAHGGGSSSPLLASGAAESLSTVRPSCFLGLQRVVSCTYGLTRRRQTRALIYSSIC